jgi:hypothetical protein
MKLEIPSVTHKAESTLDPGGKHVMIAKFPSHDFTRRTEMKEFDELWVPSFEVFEKLVF